MGCKSYIERAIEVFPETAGIYEIVKSEMSRYQSVMKKRHWELTMLFRVQILHELFFLREAFREKPLSITVYSVTDIRTTKYPSSQKGKFCKMLIGSIL